MLLLQRGRSSQSRTRLKDLVEAEWTPVNKNYRSSRTAAIAPLTDMCLVTVPKVKEIIMCTCQDRDNDEVGRVWHCSDWVRTRETHICDSNVQHMSDDRHCAYGGICPRGSDQTAQRDTTVASTKFVTAPDDSAHGNVDETNFESHKFQVRYNEADVGFIISSA